MKIFSTITLLVAAASLWSNIMAHASNEVDIMVGFLKTMLFVNAVPFLMMVSLFLHIRSFVVNAATRIESRERRT